VVLARGLPVCPGARARQRSPEYEVASLVTVLVLELASRRQEKKISQGAAGHAPGDLRNHTTSIVSCFLSFPFPLYFFSVTPAPSPPTFRYFLFPSFVHLEKPNHHLAAGVSCRSSLLCVTR
jgi:hypothetical protein